MSSKVFPLYLQATCAEVIAGPDSKTYRVKVLAPLLPIRYMETGYWKMQQAKSLFMVLWMRRRTTNFANLGMEVGDIVMVEGPKSTYGTTVELVNVTVIKIDKSLVKVDSTEIDGVNKHSAYRRWYHQRSRYLQGTRRDGRDTGWCKDWLSISSIKSSSTGAVVTFKAAANTGGDRKTTITFHTTDGTKVTPRRPPSVRRVLSLQAL